MSFILLFIPVLLWLIFTICLRKIPAPPKVYFYILVFSLLAVFSAGVLEAILISLTEKINFTSSATPSSIPNLIIPAIIEELVKLAFFYFAMLITNSLLTQTGNQAEKQAEPEYKLKVLAVLFALFFATFENIAYAINEPGQILIRCLTATVFHAGVAPFYVTTIRKKNSHIKIVSLIIILHLIYNLTSLHTLLFFTIGLGILFFCILQVIKLVINKQKNHPA